MRHVTRRPGGGGARSGAPALILVLLLTPVLLCAARPDPLWIPGVYDGGDTDELVQSVLRTHGVEPAVDRAPAPALAPVATVDGPGRADPSGLPLPPSHPRAPPVLA